MTEIKQPIVLAAGGTGGHIFPAEALAEEFCKSGERVILVTDRRFAHFKTGALADQDRGKVSLTGNPVRTSVRALKDVPYPGMAQDGKMHILITGGSQGASVFSQIVPDAIAGLPAALRARVRIDQQCREADLEA